jgi:hypothetical protein
LSLKQTGEEYAETGYMRRMQGMRESLFRERSVLG